MLKNFDELRGVFLYTAGTEPITMRDVLLSIGAAQGREPQSFRCPVRLPYALRTKSDSLVSLLNFDPTSAIEKRPLGKIQIV